MIVRTGNWSHLGDLSPEFFVFDWSSNNQPSSLLRQSKKSFNTFSTRKYLIYIEIMAFVSGFLYELSGFQSPFVRIFIRSVGFFIKTNGRLKLGQFICICTERPPSESSKYQARKPIWLLSALLKCPCIYTKAPKGSKAYKKLDTCKR